MIRPIQQPSNPGKRRTLPSVTVITRSGKSRSFRLRPWLAALAITGFAAFSVVYLGATAYLVYRDDILGTAVTRQVAMQYAFEDRIAALRSELDRITSRHMVENQGVEEQLAALLQHQVRIERRQAALDGLVEQARKTRIEVAIASVGPLPETADVAQARPIEAEHADDAPLAYVASDEPVEDVFTETLINEPGTPKRATAQTVVKPLLFQVQSSLEQVEGTQGRTLDALDAAAESERQRLSNVLAPLGIHIGEAASGGQGGPFVPAFGMHFVERVALLSRTLEEIAALRQTAEAMPLRAPLQAARTSSNFGYRIDPFLRRPALHAGLDLVAPTGTEVRAPAAGIVEAAGWTGGYGQLIEIEHGGGVSTRYGHLSEILVEPGMHVAAGAVIGRVGSTGRSTGPHLHYETRRDGEPVDPALFLAAGRAL